MALRTNAKFVEVVVEAPPTPAVMVLNEDESMVILIGFLVILSSFLAGDSNCRS